MHTWANSGPESSRRRSQRVVLSIPVTVSGETKQGPFSEKTQTLVINAHGALLTLTARIVQGQKLSLKSVTHPETQECSVVFIGPTVDGWTQYGVEFAKTTPNFWQIAFPPPDWSAAPLPNDDLGKPEKTAKK